MSSDPKASKATRRTFVFRLPTLTVVLAALKPAFSYALSPPNRLDVSAPRFFTADERAFVTAAVDRLLPADELGPGGVAADVPRFIDFQLAGSWGHGYDRYVSGPVKDGPPAQGNQAITSRAALYRTSIAALRTLPAGRNFVNANAEGRDAFLKSLQQGEHEGDQMQGMKFFAALLEDSVSGFRADPSYGGNVSFVGWKLIGYPGVRYDWTPYLQNDGRPLDMAVIGTFGPVDSYGLE
jgi:gluconate 2-dehydrogenase gamma chain